MKIRWWPVVFIFLIGTLHLLFVTSCGKRGALTFKSFEKPDPVEWIKAVHREDMIIITWSYPASMRQKIKGFYIEKAENERQEFRRIAFLGNDVAQFVDKDFKIGQQYLYKVRVQSNRGIISEDSSMLKVIPRALPQTPSGLMYKITNDSIEITWTAEKGVVYDIYKGYEKCKLSSLPLNKSPLKEPFFKDRVQAEQTIYYAVRPVFDIDIKHEGYLSECVEIKPDYFIPSRPSGLRVVVSAKKIYITWDNNAETWVKGYKIYRKKAMESDFKHIGDSVMPFFVDNEQLTGKAEYYIVALGPAKESVASDIIEVNPLQER